MTSPSPGEDARVVSAPGEDAGKGADATFDELLRFALDIRTVSITNSREHWRTKARRAADERAYVLAAWINACARQINPDEVATIHMKRLGPRKLDSDNL